MLNASRKWRRKSFAAVAVMSIPISLGFLEAVSSRAGAADPPDWPGTTTIPQATCTPVVTSCPDCDATGTEFGCTSPIPNTYRVGTCVKDAAPSHPCFTSTFDCGPYYRCGTGDPTGLPRCPKVVICNN